MKGLKSTRTPIKKTVTTQDKLNKSKASIDDKKRQTIMPSRQTVHPEVVPMSSIQ